MEATTEKPQIKPALRSLLEGLIDYAGLFPPAGLDMQTAVANYAKYKAGSYSWMLGRFVVAVARLAEFEQAWRRVGEPAGWQLSVLVAKPESELALVTEFNAKHAGKVKIDALEMKASSVAEIKAVTGFHAYVETPNTGDPTELIAALKHKSLRAKIRTGGLTAEMFPGPEVVVCFLRACAGAGVPFKATAGLHHPVRCVKPFTYEEDSPRGTMHGFLNVFLAAAFARKGYAALFLERLLAEEDAPVFRVDDDRVQWRDAILSNDEIAESRGNFAIAFGSCSFEEPISDLQALGLLP